MDYITRRFDASLARLNKLLELDLRWNIALRGLQIQLEADESAECGLEVRVVNSGIKRQIGRLSTCPSDGPWSQAELERMKTCRYENIAFPGRWSSAGRNEISSEYQFSETSTSSSRSHIYEPIDKNIQNKIIMKTNSSLSRLVMLLPLLLGAGLTLVQPCAGAPFNLRRPAAFTTARLNHTATLLPNGNVLAAGGSL